MYDIKFNSDWDRLDLALKEFQIKNREFVQDLLFELANTLLNLIIQRAPVDTGEYVKSWGIMEQTPTSIKVGSFADPRLFVMLEFTGASPHTIQPSTAEFLHWKTIDGQDRFARIVFHPGMKPQPHVRPAMLELQHRVKGIVYAVSARHFTLLKVEGQKAAMANGYRRPIRVASAGRSNIGRPNVDVTANIGRGTKGKISAQLLSRISFKKRIKIQGLRRVGTSEKKKAGFR